MPDLLTASDNLRQGIIDRLLDSIPDIQIRTFERIERLLDEFTRDGDSFKAESTNTKKLLRLQSEIEEILNKAGYYKAANLYISDLSEITANTMLLHESLNNKDVTKKPLTDIQKIYQQTALNTLSEGGLNTNFVAPVTTLINEALTYGYSISDTRQNLKDYIVGTETQGGNVGKLKSYLTVTARDAVTQLQGAQHQAIQKAFDMPYLRYVGGELKDSRGQCVRWLKMGYIAMDELQDEIDLAFKNQASGVEEPKGHKFSGMIKDTKAENFIIRRGGWGCLQSAIPVRVRG